MNLESPYKMLDGASGFGFAISSESQELTEIVTDQSNPLIDRLEAYEDIINLEVGDTSFTRARNVERESGFRQLYLKFEGGNPTGTQKDRIAFSQCLDAIRRGYDTITLATCGNYGVSCALASKLAGLNCIICIPQDYHSLRLTEIEKMEAKVIRTSGSYEDAVDYSKKLAVNKDYYDANPGGANTHLQLLSYSEIAIEIYDQLRDAPKIVSVPVSNGTLLAGVYRGFATLFKRGKTSRIPKFIAGSAYKKNPIILSYKNNLESCSDLDPKSIRETKINEPLINWHSFDGDEALWSLRKSGGWAMDISDAKMSYYSKLLKEKEGLNVLPASTAGLIALLEWMKTNPSEGDRYVAILTGRK